MGEGGHEKLIYRRELPKKRDLDSLQIRGGGLGIKEEGVFLRVWERCYPNAQHEIGNNFNCDFNLLMPMFSLLISIKKKYCLAIDSLLIITFDVVRR